MRIGATAGASSRADQLLEEAVALDTGFAMAWRRLGVNYGNVGERAKQRHAMQNALRHQDRLTERERYLTLGHVLHPGRYPAAEGAFRVQCPPRHRAGQLSSSQQSGAGLCPAEESSEGKRVLSPRDRSAIPAPPPPGSTWSRGLSLPGNRTARRPYCGRRRTSSRTTAGHRGSPLNSPFHRGDTTRRESSTPVSGPHPRSARKRRVRQQQTWHR